MNKNRKPDYMELADMMTGWLEGLVDSDVEILRDNSAIVFHLTNAQDKCRTCVKSLRLTVKEKETILFYLEQEIESGFESLNDGSDDLEQAVLDLADIINIKRMIGGE